AAVVETAPVVAFVFAMPPVTPEVYTLSLHDALPIFPVGAVATTGVASVTVAVQLVGLPTGTEAGMQLTLVAVECLVAVTAAGGRAEEHTSALPSRLAIVCCVLLVERV